MKMKLAFSLALSLILIISVSSTILLIGTPSPVLGHDSGHGSGDDGGDGGGDGGDGGDHGGNGGGDGGDGGDGGGNGGDDDGDGGDHDGDGGGNGEDDDEVWDWVEADVEALWQIDLPEGQELGDVQSIRDVNGDIIVTEDGVPLLGRQIFDSETGAPISNYDDWGNSEPIYITNVGRVSVPVTYYRELGPGFRSGPGYERFAYTPPPGAPPSENLDGQTQDSPPSAPIPEPENQDGELSPSEAFDDDTQFGEPQPVMDPTGSPLVDEGGAPVLGQAVLDEEGESVIGPNGKPIIVIPD